MAGERVAREVRYPLRHDVDLHLAVMSVRRLPFLAGLSEVDRAMLRDALLHGRSCNIFYLPVLMKVDLFAVGPAPFDEIEFARKRPHRVRASGCGCAGGQSRGLGPLRAASACSVRVRGAQPAPRRVLPRPRADRGAAALRRDPGTGRRRTRSFQRTRPRLPAPPVRRGAVESQLKLRQKRRSPRQD